MWSDARVFKAMIRHLRRPARVVALDFPGHGARAREPAARTMEDLARTYLAAIPADRSPAVLGGISMGAVAALHAALLAPERVAGLALFAGTASAESHWRRIVYRAAAEVYRWTGPVAPLRWGVRHVAFGPAAREVDPEFRSVLRQAAAVPRETIAASLALMADRPEIGNRLHRIGVPVMVIAGECDRVFPPGEALKLARRLPQAQLRILPRTGHAIIVERPAVAARLTDELLDRVQLAPFRG
jgi:pimeloyl-ACP methyl ester carboxylesterase